jgi:fatty acid synthase subunit alpha
VMIAGGFDSISEEGSYKFADMKATSDAETEFAMGREPTEMSRPATTSHAGVIRLGVLSIHGTSTGANVCEVSFQFVMLLNH